jgi:glycosyltransferase involved in cell wall biosynthesis
MNQPSVKIDSRMWWPGLGIANVIERLMLEFATSGFDGAFCSPDLDRERRLKFSADFIKASVSPALGCRSANVFHYLSNVGSLHQPRRSIVTVHDFMALDSKRPRDKIYSASLLHSVKKAQIVTSLSEETAKLINEMEITKNPVRLIPNGVTARKCFSSERQNELVAFGAPGTRKRTSLLIDLQPGLEKSNFTLTVLTRQSPDSEFVATLRSSKINVVCNLTSSEVAARLTTCHGVLITSAHEGFGLPFVEASEAGAWVFYGADAVVPKYVEGPHALPVDLFDAESLVQAVKATLGKTPVFPNHWLSWKQVAERYVEAYYEIYDS